MNHRNELLTILNFHNIAKDLGFLYKSSFPGVSCRIGVLQENTYHGAEHFFYKRPPDYYLYLSIVVKFLS